MMSETSVWLEHHHPRHSPVRAEAVVSRSCANVFDSLEQRGIDLAGAECNDDLLALAHAVEMYDGACGTTRAFGRARGGAPALPPRRADEALGSYVERLTRDAHRLAHHCG